jgi:hypothetical protein
MRNGEGMVRVRSVEPLQGLSVRLQFTDGTRRDVDLSQFMRGPVFGELRDDVRLFRQVRVDEQLGTIVWPNGADIDPDVLYGAANPEWGGATEAS